MSKKIQNFRATSTVQAMQWEGETGEYDVFVDFAEETSQVLGLHGRSLAVFTPLGSVLCNPTDWLVRNHTGKLSVLSDHIFHQQYERVESPAPRTPMSKRA